MKICAEIVGTGKKRIRMGIKMNKDLNQYRVKEIRSSNGIHKLGYLAEIVDEGSFYRIDGTHIIDKFRISSITIDGNQLTVHMKDRDIILIVEQKL